MLVQLNSRVPSNEQTSFFLTTFSWISMTDFAKNYALLVLQSNKTVAIWGIGTLTNWFKIPGSISAIAARQAHRKKIY